MILAYQVWYLAPSLPARTLIKTHPEAFRDRRVITVIACRNMWYSAAIEVAGLLRSAGALGRGGRRHRHQAAGGDIVTTLRWLLTGKREPFMRFGRAGVGADELERVARVGRELAAGIAPRMPLPSYRPWLPRISWRASCFGDGGATVRSAGRVGPVAQAASLVVFVLGLGIGIAVGLPVIACAALLGGARFRSGVRQYLHQRISQPMTAQGSDMRSSPTG